MSADTESSISFANRKGKINARILSPCPEDSNGDSPPPLIILHGLLGSSRNWLSAGKLLGTNRQVFALDLPDHGESDWSDEPSFEEMSMRIQCWMAEQGIDHADWLGHSLGGKVALRIASDSPEKVRRLVLADIFPRIYPPHHKEDFEAMASLDLESLPDRKAADLELSRKVEDWALRQFLLTNLERLPNSGFRWQVNLEGLQRRLPVLAGLPFEGRDPVTCPTLLIYGGASDFVRDEDLEEAEEYFVDARAVRLPGIGHNLHVEARDAFVRGVGEFLK